MKNLSGQIFKNNMYALRMAASLSKKRVILSVIQQTIGYLLWVFYSAFFVRFILDAISKKQDVKQVLISIAIIGGASFVLEMFQYYCSDRLFPMLNVKVYHGLYEQVYEKSENLEIGCFETSEFYDKFSVALDDMGTKLCDTVDNMATVVGGIIGGILACYTMVEIDPWTIIFLIAPLIGNFLFAPKMNEIYYKRYLDGVPFERKMKYVNRIMYLPEYVKEFRLSKIFHVVKRQYEEAVEGKSSIWQKYFKKSYILGLLQYIFSYMIIFEGILLYGAYRAMIPQSHMISFAQMAVLTSVMVTASWVWVGVINSFNAGTKNSLLISNLREFFEYEEKIPENQEGETPPETIESIEFCGVSFAYGDNEVLREVSFQVKGTGSIVFVGHNGAGKSTLVKLLLRLHDPTEGVILVNGKDIRQYNLRQYRQLFCMAFQDGVIIPGSVKSNVLMGREGSDKDVKHALMMAGVWEKVESLPDGMDSVLTREFDEKGVLLSGGEYQKIIVARAFANEAPIGIFDEPSSALDPISESQLFDSILTNAKGKMAILISHRLSSVRDADYVYMLEQGRIIEQGNHTKLMDEQSEYAKMYHIQEQNYLAIDREGEVMPCE